MEINKLIRVKTRQELRVWLEENSQTEKFCWVLIGTARQPDALQYLDVVEEALCFGWIDSTKKGCPILNSLSACLPARKRAIGQS